MRAASPHRCRAVAARAATTLLTASIVAGCTDAASLDGPRPLAAATPMTIIAPRALSLPATELVAAAPALVDPTPAWSVSVDALAGRFGCLPDGMASGAWTVRFAGYGCASVGALGDTTLLALRPAVASVADETHAGLLLGPAIDTADVDVHARLLTSHQLRVGTAPNPWEVGWLVWHYTDDAHFYYFIAKPNGWELGKRDPAYPGGQRFLATGSSPQFPVGDWHDVSVTQRGSTITVRANGRELVTFVDAEAAYTRGNVGVYSEDAAVVARIE